MSYFWVESKNMIHLRKRALEADLEISPTKSTKFKHTVAVCAFTLLLISHMKGGFGDDDENTVQHWRI